VERGAALIGGFFARYRLLNAKAAGVLLASLVTLSAALIPMYGLGIPYLTGILLCAAVLLPRRSLRFPFRVDRISECAFGIYLVNFFWWPFVLRIPFVTGALFPIGIFVVSAISILILKKFFPSLSRIIV
jgi:hypothetical protein